MAAATLGQVGAWPAGAGGSGEPDGGAHFRVDHWRAAFPAWRHSSVVRVPLPGKEADGPPWEGGLGYNGRAAEWVDRSGVRELLNRELGSGEPWRRTVMGEVRGGVDMGKFWLGRAACVF